MYDNSEDIFIDWTFYSALKCVYQILIVRVNIKGTQQYTTTCLALCTNKKEELYYKILSEINRNINFTRKKYLTLKEEFALSNSIKRVGNNSQIKYWFFTFSKLLKEKEKNYWFI